MNIPRICLVAAIGAAMAAAAGASMTSCAQTPPNVTTHSLQQSQKLDVVCIQVNDANGNPVVPVPVEEGQCAPVAANVVGQTLPYHLYGLVTQTTLGEIAVVDLTAGNVVDVDRTTPGVDFVPVGANPTDVAVSHDGQLSFVSSADPNKMAIYAIDNRRLLGDSILAGDGGALRLTDLSACALPQPPQALAVVPMSAQDGGATGSYALVALLRASGGAPASVIAIDPAVLSSAPPGSLPACAFLGAVIGGTVLSGALPAAPSGVPWPDGVPYADAGGSTGVPGCLGAAGADDGGNTDAGDAGANATTEGGPASPPLGPPQPTSMALRSDVPVLYIADNAVPVIHVIDLHDPTHPVELDPLVATSAVDPARRVSVGPIAISPPTHDYKTYLYAIDALQGTVMVYDVTDAASSPRSPMVRPHQELNPLAPPDRLSFSSPVASVAFAQHDWPLPSQSDPNHYHQYTGLLCNPNPNAHPDAGAFVDNGAYYRVDQAPLIQSMDTLGGTVQSFPTRLRGVFGFATLSNGNVVTLDVDDWDAPCRRPDPMTAGAFVTENGVATYSGGISGVLDVPEPAPSASDLDPYHAPLTYNPVLGDTPAVTLEAFFPVSAPHRMRSSFLLRNDPLTGLHIPNLLGAPQLFNASGSPVATLASGASPLLLPTPLAPGYVDPTYVANPTEPNPQSRTFLSQGLATPAASASIPPVLFPGQSATGPTGVRVSFDDPTAHQDQDWTVTYEGALPTVSGIAADIDSTLPDPNAYQTLTLSATGARFCARGIEDWTVGQARANTMLTALNDAFQSSPPNGIDEQSLPQWTSDYVEILDDPLPADDPYWAEPSSANDCWDGDLADDKSLLTSSPLGQDRYNFCAQNFGAAVNADAYLARDLPILHAHDDSLEVGRFGWVSSDTSPVAEQTTTRVVVGAVPGSNANPAFLRPTRCCFHHQVTFKVRTGGEWVAVGSSVGLLHQVVKAPDGSCVLSCDPRTALMNARAFDVPWSTAPACAAPAVLPTLNRDSVLAMRNPMFSFVMWGACGARPLGSLDHTLATRDLTWRFSMRGSFSPLTVSLVSPVTGGAVNPQSMRFIDSLGQVAVVDSESQGLVLIDLNLVAVAHNYF
jgi:hypothetical protein